MPDLISIHIPRTGGTSFYQILQEVYGEQLSISYRRKDYRTAVQNGAVFSTTLNEKIKILHGHLYYKEIQQIHRDSNAKVICWLRNPVNRVLSNYRHFIFRNSAPNAIRPNQHRINESLLTYARLEQNRNRMSRFLAGIELEELFFVGLLESFAEDLAFLAGLLNWPTFDIPKLNAVHSNAMEVSREVHMEIKALNLADYELYNRALTLVAKRRG